MWAGYMVENVSSETLNSCVGRRELLCGVRALRLVVYGWFEVNYFINYFIKCK